MASPARVEDTASALGGIATRWSGPSRTGRPRRLRRTRRLERNVVDSVLGVAVMVAALVTPFDRRQRRRWGMGHIDIDRAYPGDDLVDQARRGEIRTGRWQRFSAVQVLAPPDGFVWAATAGANAWPNGVFFRASIDAARYH